MHHVWLQVDRYLNAWEANVAEFKIFWKTTSLAPYVDVDTLLTGLDQYVHDLAFLQGVFLNSVSHVVELVGNMVASPGPPTVHCFPTLP